MRPSQNIRESIGFAGDVDDTSFHVKMSDRKFVSKCLQIVRRSHRLLFHKNMGTEVK